MLRCTMTFIRWATEFGGRRKVIKGGLNRPECSFISFHQQISFLFLQSLYLFAHFDTH